VVFDGHAGDEGQLSDKQVESPERTLSVSLAGGTHCQIALVFPTPRANVGRFLDLMLENREKVDTSTCPIQTRPRFLPGTGLASLGTTQAKSCEE
jgi:hypothetical protein